MPRLGVLKWPRAFRIDDLTCELLDKASLMRSRSLSVTFCRYFWEGMRTWSLPERARRGKITPEAGRRYFIRHYMVDVHTKEALRDLIAQGYTYSWIARYIVGRRLREGGPIPYIGTALKPTKRLATQRRIRESRNRDKLPKEGSSIPSGGISDQISS